MAYTKGPWRACMTDSHFCANIASDEHPVAKVTSGDWGDPYLRIRLGNDSQRQTAKAVMEKIVYGHVDEEEAKANACLIAAAPELLDALELILPLAKGYAPEGQTNIALATCRSWIAAAEAAVAKARGEQ